PHRHQEHQTHRPRVHELHQLQDSYTPGQRRENRSVNTDHNRPFTTNREEPRNGGSFSMPGSGEPAHGKARTAGGLAGAPAAVPMRVRRLGAAVCETFRRESGVVRGRGLAMLLSLTPCPVTDHSVRGLSLDPPAVWLLRA